jgi:hypothetical protein
VDAELKTKWIEALRSGRYMQCKFCLRSPSNAYCCLGVMCDVSGEGKWNPDNSYRVGDEYTAYVPPPVWSAEKGLSEASVRILCDLNDEKQASFAEIADYIEANL